MAGDGVEEIKAEPFKDELRGEAWSGPLGFPGCLGDGPDAPLADLVVEVTVVTP